MRIGTLQHAVARHVSIRASGVKPGSPRRLFTRPGWRAVIRAQSREDARLGPHSLTSFLLLCVSGSLLATPKSERPECNAILLCAFARQNSYPRSRCEIATLHHAVARHVSIRASGAKRGSPRGHCSPHFSPHIPSATESSFATLRATLLPAQSMWDATDIDHDVLQVSIVSIRASRVGRDIRGRPSEHAHLRVSIRASRVGRDSSPAGLPPFPGFNPRVPCGTRHRSEEMMPFENRFNPRVPCGTRLFVGPRSGPFILFQSARPVWDATESPDDQE